MGEDAAHGGGDVVTGWASPGCVQDSLYSLQEINSSAVTDNSSRLCLN